MDLSTARTLRVTPTCAYIMFIQGVKYAFVTEHTGNGLLGSGAGTWIAVQESDLGETVGQREVKRGLVMPDVLPTGTLDVKRGMPDAEPVSFELVDLDGTVADLFSGDGKDRDVLAQRIAPGNGSLAGSISVNGGTDTVTVAGKNIGIERIGPNGEREYFYPLPFVFPNTTQPVGPEHSVHANAQTDAGPPPVLVSDDPIVFAGRMVTVYRLYCDPDGDPSDYTAWYDWREQHDAGNLVWIGTMSDSGEITGSRVWSIECKGTDSLLRRKLGQRSHGEWMTVATADVELAPHERKVGVQFEIFDPAPADTVGYNSTAFTVDLAATGTKLERAQEIDAIIQDTISGAIGDYDTGTAVDTVKSSEARMNDDGSISLRIDDDNADPEALKLSLIIHGRVWRLLGWEPAAQNGGDDLNNLYFENEHQAVFGPVLPDHAPGLPDNNNSVGADGYWKGSFYTMAIGAQWHDADQYDNEGHLRTYKPLFDGSLVTFGANPSGQTFNVAASFPYIQAQPTVPYSVNSTVDSAQADRSRYFAFRGKIVKGTINANGELVNEEGQIVEEIEEEEIYQVARVAWRDGGTHGAVHEVDGTPQFVLERWIDPRPFGFNFAPLTGEWVSTVTGDFKIECIPLYTYGYAEYGESLENALSVLYQVLLSTGDASGYGDVLENNPSFTKGDNSPTVETATFWLGDVELGDMGLGLHKDLVQDPADAYEVFAQLPGGVNSPLNKVRYAYGPGYDSYSILQSIITNRGLSITYHGGKIGVHLLGPFAPADADVEITEDDLYGRQADPTSVIPRQRLRATGQLDKAVLSYRYNPAEDGPVMEITQESRDPQTIARTGDLELKLRDDGLVPPEWNAPHTENHDWKQAWRELWAFDRPRFFAKRHFLVENLVVSRPKGQDVRMGTRVRVTNPWILDPSTATYGVTNAVGVVTKAQVHTKHHATELSCILYSDQFGDFRYFMPVGKILAIDGPTVHLYPDSQFLAHGGAADAGRFSETLSGLGGDAEVAVLTYDRTTWALHGETETVASVDASANTVTLNSAFTSEPERDLDKYLLMEVYDTQGAAWVQGLGIVVVLDDGTFGSGPTDGWELLDS